MLSPNYLAPLLLLLCSGRLHADAGCLTPDCLTKCLNDSIQFEGNHHLQSYKKRAGQIYEVMGLTKDCVFYTFILGDTSTNTSLPSWTNKYEKTGHCEGKRLMQMRTAGINRRMVFIVDFMGRRVRIQSIFDSRSQTVDGVLYMLPDVKDRRLHAYTQPLEKGYTLESIYNANYHVYVIARNHYEFRIYELTVEMDIHLNLVPYLRKESSGIDPALQPPFEAPEVTVFHDIGMDPTATWLNPVPYDKFNKWCGLAYGIEELQEFLNEEETVKLVIARYFDKNTRDNETFVIVRELVDKVWTNFQNWLSEGPNTVREASIREECEKQEPVRKDTAWGIALWHKQKAERSLAIPYISIMRGNSRGISPRQGNVAPGFRYLEKKGRFKLNRKDACIANMNYVMLYYYQMEANPSGGYGTLNYHTYPTKRFFNEVNFHRRMAPPHSLTHRHPLKFRKGTAEVVVSFIGVFLPMVAVFAVIGLVKWVGKMMRKKKRGYSDSQTHTN